MSWGEKTSYSCVTVPKIVDITDMLILALQRSTNALRNHVKMAAAAPTRLPATVACVLRDTPEITARRVSFTLSAPPH